jgi:hypothetical protein
MATTNRATRLQTQGGEREVGRKAADARYQARFFAAKAKAAKATK